MTDQEIKLEIVKALISHALGNERLQMINIAETLFEWIKADTSKEPVKIGEPDGRRRKADK